MSNFHLKNPSLKVCLFGSEIGWMENFFEVCVWLNEEKKKSEEEQSTDEALCAGVHEYFHSLSNSIFSL